MVQNHYYRHSGQFALTSVLIGTVAAAAGGSLLAAAYAALVLYIPFAGVITFLLAIGFGLLLGLIIAAALRWAKVRHEGVAFFSATTAALTAFYVSWAVWTWLLLRQSDVEAQLMALVPQPGVLWELLGEINTVGAWSMSGFTPTGPVLWVLWGAEALLVLAPAVLVPLGVLAVPFCERCERWCEPSEDLARLAACDSSELKTRLDSKELDVLTELGAPAPHDDAWIRVDLHRCPSCDNLHTLSLKSISTTVGDDGERQHKELEVVSHLLLSNEEAHRMRELQPPPQEPVEVG